MKKTILLQAAPFCFGPISTTLTVARGLLALGDDLEFVIIAEGPTGDLIRRAQLPIQCISGSTISPCSPIIEKSIDAADLVITNTDPLFADLCIKRGARVAIIDTLFWMWDTLPPSSFNADLYIAQRFINNDVQRQRLGTPNNYLEVGPLIQPQAAPVPPSQRQKTILVSVGGCDCTLTDPHLDPYPSLILKTLQEIRPWLEGYKVVFVGGERATCSLMNASGNWHIGTLSPDDYLQSMRLASAALISPGLTGTMEVLQAQTPVFFFPPQNYSQVLQLDAFRTAEIAPHSFCWSDVYPSFHLPYYLPEEEAVRRVKTTINTFINDPAAISILKERLVDFLASLAEYDPLPGQVYRSRFGMNGPQDSVMAIQALLDTM